MLNLSSNKGIVCALCQDFVPYTEAHTCPARLNPERDLQKIINRAFVLSGDTQSFVNDLLKVVNGGPESSQTSALRQKLWETIREIRFNLGQAEEILSPGSDASK